MSQPVSGHASPIPSISVEEVAKILGLKKNVVGEWAGKNPTGNGAGDDGFILFKDGNAYDRKISQSYSSIEVAKMAGIDPDYYEPVLRYNNGARARPVSAYAETHPIAAIIEPIEKQKPEVEKQKPMPEKDVAEKKYDLRLLTERGISQETLDEFFVERHGEYYEFPTFSINGSESGPGRSRRKMIDPVVSGLKHKMKKPVKYMWAYGDTDPIPPGYNLQVCHEFTEIWIVGGEVDVWSCHEIGIPAVCGFGETRKLQDLISAIKKAEIKKVHVALDNDKSGKTGAVNIYDLCKEVGLECTVRQLIGAIGNDINNVYENCGFDKERAKMAIQALPHASKATIDNWKFNAPENPKETSKEEETGEKKKGRPAGSKNGSSEEKMQKTEILVHLLTDAEIFLDKGEELYLGFKGSDGIIRNYHQDDANLRSDLFDFFYEQTGKSISNDVVVNAMNILRGRARRLKIQDEVWLRVAPHKSEDGEDSIFINLGDRDARVIEINDKFDYGWRVTQNAPLRFRWPKGMQPLPVPEYGGNIDDLRECINAEDPAVWMMMISWLLYAMHPPKRPYPVLVLTGEQGTAKSTTSRMLRLLIDPHFSLISSISAMKDAEDMTTLCHTSHMLGFDNLSGLHGWQSDLLSQIATDGSIPRRKRYTDNETAVTQALCPMILNGIDESLGKEDFQSRSIRCNLPYIQSKSRKDEEAIWTRYNEIRPKMIGALCTMLSVALRERPKVQVGELPRMADFAKWIIAAENGGAMPWDKGSFLLNYFGNIKEISESALEANPVALEIIRLLHETPVIESSATELLETLNNKAKFESKSHFAWPSAPNKLSAMLNRIAPVLRDNHVNINLNGRRGSGRQRYIKIMAVAPEDQQMLMPNVNELEE